MGKRHLDGDHEYGPVSDPQRHGRQRVLLAALADRTRVRHG
jgi:hypothetical protein